MATALVGGLVMAGVVGGTTAAAIATTVALTAAAAIADQMIFAADEPDAPQYDPSQAPSIDKTQLTEAGKVGKLQLGESDAAGKRAKGKDQFKIALAQEREDDDEEGSDAPDLGVAAPTAKTAGVQLG